MLVELHHKDSTALIIISHAEKKNAINEEVLLGLWEAFKQIAEEKSTAVIMTGKGAEAFCSGMDINWLSSVNQTGIRKLTALAQKVVDYIEDFPKPVISAVNGMALGAGCILSLVSDFRIASTTARFGFPEIKLGIPNVLLGPLRLQYYLHVGKVKELLLKGDPISADEAFAMGLVNRVVEPEKLLSESFTLAEEIALGGPLGLELNKKLISLACKNKRLLYNQFEIDTVGFYWGTDDFKEGMNAFFQRRPPLFRGF